MVTRMDRTIGLVVDKIKELGLAENTLIIFTSDNGPTHNAGGADSDFFNSAGHLRGLKGSVYEGGIRAPFFAYWPGHIEPGSRCDTPFYFPDVMPTFCELAGAKVPDDIDGVSLVPTLLGKPGQKTHQALYWEFPGYGGQQAVRVGNWKAVRQSLGRGVIKTELYDLMSDPGEQNDLATLHPEIVARLEQVMKDSRTPNEVFPLQSIDFTPKPKKAKK